jgi:hypothetical protein
MFGASMAFAQAGAGSIGVFSDQAGTNCNLVDGGSYAYVYIHHLNTTGALASEFKLIRPEGWAFFAAQDVTAFLKIGFPDEEGGVSYAYQTCQTGSFLVQGIIYTSDGSSPVCSNTVYITNVPTKTDIEVINCSDVRLVATGGAMVVNGDGSCPCNVPVEETTWGKVKSLYQ